MRILLVHQNFPGQFRDIAPKLCDLGHELKAISCSQRQTDGRIEVLRYDYAQPVRQGIHALSAEVDEWIRRGELVGKLAEGLRRRGWAPDVMLAHPGWGEAMLLKQIFPATPLVIWPELWLQPEHMGVNSTSMTVEQAQYLRVKNWLVDGAMADASLAILPTAYQAGSFPERWQNKLEIIPEGIPDHLFSMPRLSQLTISPSVTLGTENKVVSFISRNLEPMRGFPTFMRAIPDLQKRMPELEVVIVGGDGLSYSSAPGEGKTWKQVMLEELQENLDLSRVHFLGRIPHQELIKLYRRSDLHLYLSNAFVLSWSLLEVMACGTPVLTADNPMMREINSQVPGNKVWNATSQSLSTAILEAINSKGTDKTASSQHLYQTHSLSKTVNCLAKCLEMVTTGRF